MEHRDGVRPDWYPYFCAELLCENAEESRQQERFTKITNPTGGNYGRISFCGSGAGPRKREL